MASLMSDTKTVNNKGPRTDPCGTPLIVASHPDSLVPVTTFCDLPDKYELTHERASSQRPAALSLAEIRRWFAQSNE